MVLFASRFIPPPGGEYFFEYEGESFRTRDYEDAIRKTRDIMARHGRATAYAPSVLAEFMCPYMPDGFCTKNYGNKRFTVDEAREAAMPYFKLPVVPFDEIERRMLVCQRCPKRSRTFCVSCLGVLPWMQSLFRGARRLMPIDRYSGVCGCAGTFDAVVSSVDAEALPAWKEEPPDTCWRKTSHEQD